MTEKKDAKVCDFRCEPKPSGDAGKERPMPENKNALAELAEDLEHDNFFGCDHFKQELWVGKAQRIVAELAKVSSGHWDNICDGPPAYICDAGDLKIGCCIGHCRAIAEEGESRQMKIELGGNVNDRLQELKGT